MDDALLRDLRVRLATVLGDQFEIGDRLGTGGFAAVFRARDRLLGRDVAIKVFDPSLSLGAEAADRLLDEARLVAAIEHPHIVPLYEAGLRDGLVFLVMRCLPDGTVGARLRRTGRWAAAEVIRLGVEVAEALAAAHARGVVHLDIKPDNILLDSHGNAAVSDFGIARAIAGAGPAPNGLVSGTPHYMSPEQVAGDRLDGRTDVYALGVVLYELVTGTLPVTGDSSAQIMANVIRQAPAQLSRMAPELPSALASVITRALKKDPADRWASAGEMAEALRAAGATDQLLAPRVVRRRTRRRWYGRAAMIVGGLTVGVGVVGYLVIRALGAFSKGEPPALDALGPLIPPALADSARALAGLGENDSIRYLFTPHGHTLAEALVVTPRELIALRRGGAPMRYRFEDDFSVNLRRVNQRGLLVIGPPRAKQGDTIYTTMSGLEQQILSLALRRVLTPPASP